MKKVQGDPFLPKVGEHQGDRRAQPIKEGTLERVRPKGSFRDLKFLAGAAGQP